MTARENPLGIDYSLRIGTSVYHVLGKRRKSRRTKYDYYVMDDKLIRSKSNKNATRPRSIVDDPDTNKKKPSRARSALPKRPALDTEQIKKAMVETMDDERDKIVTSLRVAVAEENDAAYKANRNKDKISTDLIKRTIRETLNVQNESLTPLEQLEEKLVQVIEREIEKMRLETETTKQDNNKAKKDEEKRMIRLFDEQTQVLTNALNQQQQQATTTSLDRIKDVVAETLKSQQRQQQLVSQQDIKQLEDRLIDTMKEMVNAQKSLKIIDDLDIRASTDDISKLKRQKQNDNGQTDDNQSSTEPKQVSKNTLTQQPSIELDSDNEHQKFKTSND